MENENKLNEVENDTPSNENYIDAIKQMKENSVSKEKYQKLESENAKLLEAIMEGKEIDNLEKSADPGESIEELRKELFNPESNLSNLEYCKKMLELREKYMAEDPKRLDPMLPNNGKVTADDIAGVEKAVNAIQTAIDIADGDSEVFTAKLTSMMRDDPLVLARLKGRK